MNREHWLVLYDPSCRSIATDMESRFSEAALGSIKTSDMRNFAHGRHHWIAKREAASAVIILSNPGTRRSSPQEHLVYFRRGHFREFICSFQESSILSARGWYPPFHANRWMGG